MKTKCPWCKNEHEAPTCSMEYNCPNCGAVIRFTSLSDAVSRYGEGDNYLRDSMYYEVALDICKKLESMQAPLTSRIAVEITRQKIEKAISEALKNK